jgi:REP element-mobilizing transposase RayT
MARMPRIVVAGYPHHVTQRGNRRQQTFFREDDYRYYIELVSKYAQQANTEIWAYCLMPNHVHLVMVPDREDGLRAALGEAHRHYTRHINCRHDWRGHLMAGTFSFVSHGRRSSACGRALRRKEPGRGQAMRLARTVALVECHGPSSRTGRRPG